MNSKIILICDVCLSRNYHLKINHKSNKRLELNKYCPNCNKAQIHKETR